jgi:hypothetical protein
MLNAIDGIDPQPATIQNQELGKYEKDNSRWPSSENGSTQSAKALGSSPWMTSNQALLGSKPDLALHDEGPRSSISASIVSRQDEVPPYSQLAFEPASPTLSTSSQKGSPMEAMDFIFPAPGFPDPVKVQPVIRTNEYDRKISPLSLPQRPFPKPGVRNFSRPTSRGGEPQIPLPDHGELQRQVRQSQRSLTLSSIRSDFAESGQLPNERLLNGRPKTTVFEMLEENLTALPPVPPIPPPKDVAKSQAVWI